MPFFTVLIPTYNRADLLARALDSVLAQTFADFEIVVVDDGSTDSTTRLLDRYQADVRVRTFRQENQGQSAARNLGIQESRGEYVAFLDSDDLWFPWTLQNIYQAIQLHDRPACLATTSVSFVEDDQLHSVQPGKIKSTEYADLFSFFEAGPGCVFPAGLLVIQTSLLRAVGGFPKSRNNSEDIDLCLRIGTSGKFVLLSEPVSSGHREHTGSISLSFQRGADGLFEVIAKERLGQFPGGRLRRRARWKLITFISRAVSVGAARAGNRGAAWALYRRCLTWHLALGRFRYLVGFPLLALRCMFSDRHQASRPSGTG